MGSFQAWENPLPFIVTENNKLKIEEKASYLLQQITHPIVVAAIAGSYRTGKSYLMNRLAKRQQGFPLGSEIQSKTKGVWIWCVNHPIRANTVLILIDTEGLSDPEKNDDQHDMMIFSLAVLLSTIFVFNATGKIDQTMIDKLYFVTELTERIKVKMNQSDTDNDEDQYEDYLKFFPIFVLSVRDFTLELKLDGQELTPDEYFKHILKLKRGKTKSIINYNLPREAIRNAFRSHHCFIFTRPVHDEKLFPRLEELQESDLSQEFLQQSAQFCNFIYNNGSVKKMKQGQDINGRLLLGMAESYIQAINAGSIPCIESTIAVVTEKENERVQNEVITKYCQKMNSLPYPVSEKSLKEAHTLAYKEALEHFHNSCFLDEEGKYFTRLTEHLIQEFFNCINHNENLSFEKCTHTIQNLHNTLIMDALKKGDFMCARGYKRYEEQMQLLLLKYDKETTEETKAESVKQDFLIEKETEREAIMNADSTMTAKDKEIQNALKEKTAAELEIRLKEEEINTEKERWKQIQIEHEQEVQKLKQELTKLEKYQTKELEELIETRLKEKEILLTEGFIEKATELQAEIEKFNGEKDSKGFFMRALDVIDRAAIVFTNVATLRTLWKSVSSEKRSKLSCPFSKKRSEDPT